VSSAKILTPGQQFAQYALQHAYEALDELIQLRRFAHSPATSDLPPDTGRIAAPPRTGAASRLPNGCQYGRMAIAPGE
jgi:hypothetical protein